MVKAYVQVHSNATDGIVGKLSYQVGFHIKSKRYWTPTLIYFNGTTRRMPLLENTKAPNYIYYPLESFPITQWTQWINDTLTFLMPQLSLNLKSRYK